MSNKYNDIVGRVLNINPGQTNPYVKILNLRNERGMNVKPDAEDLDYGQIAINYTKGNETIFLKNDSNEVISIGSTESITFRIDEVEQNLQEQIDAINGSGDGSYAEADKILEEKLKEYFLSEIEKIHGANTDSVILVVDPVSREITANVVISPDEGNDLKINENGLYCHTSVMDCGEITDI